MGCLVYQSSNWLKNFRSLSVQTFDFNLQNGQFSVSSLEIYIHLSPIVLSLQNRSMNINKCSNKSTPEISKSCNHENISLGIVQRHILVARPKVEQLISLLVEQRRFGGHGTVHNSELTACFAPKLTKLFVFVF